MTNILSYFYHVSEVIKKMSHFDWQLATYYPKDAMCLLEWLLICNVPNKYTAYTSMYLYSTDVDLQQLHDVTTFITHK